VVLVAADPARRLSDRAALVERDRDVIVGNGAIDLGLWRLPRAIWTAAPSKPAISRRAGVPHDIRGSTMRRASNSTRDGHANASSHRGRFRLQTLIVANSAPLDREAARQLPKRRYGCPAHRSSLSKGAPTQQVRGLGPVHGSMWGWGNGVSIHTVSNSLRRGMFRPMFARSLVADRRRPPGWPLSSTRPC
jgi:hypothetical protein